MKKSTPKKDLHVGVFGSAVDPFHVGHEKIIQNMINSKLYDLVVFILSGTHNGKNYTACPHHRVAMTQLGIRQTWFLSTHPRFIVIYEDAYNLNTPTIQYFNKLYEEFQTDTLEPIIHWVVGADLITPRDKYNNLCEIQHRWIQGEQVMRQNIDVAPREGYSHPDDLRERLPYWFKFRTLDFTLPKVSSTCIREFLETGNSARNLVTQGWLNKNVAEYITAHQLYRRV